MANLAADTARYLAQHKADLAAHTLQHVEISLIAIAIGVAIALPLGLVLGHTGRGGFLAINASNVGRALPSLALIAIALPYLGLTESSLVFALTLLALPPVLTNAYVAVREVDRDVVEAARGMGLSGTQVLRGVELPLATPVIVSGIRTAAVQVVATVALGALFTGGGLGRDIVDGLANNSPAQAAAGALGVALLAVVTEVGLGLAERAVTPRALRLAGPPTDRGRELAVAAGPAGTPT
jgi:osmoprotectant transport system permease protein